MSNSKKFLGVLLAGIIALVAEFGFGHPTLAMGIVTLVGIITSISMFMGMIATLRSGRYGVDLLALTAIIATLAVGEYWASLMVLIMLTGGDSLEDYASRQANQELQALLDHAPEIAHVSVNGQQKDLPADQVALNDKILVRPGEVIPVDGIILEGKSQVDQASLTGEAQPVEKNIDDEVMSGSVNGDGLLTVKVTKLAADSQYQTLVKLVKESQEKPANFVRLADRYAVPFTIIAYLIGGIAWFVSKDATRFAEVLVVASPCPLILAAPIALVAGMSRSSRHGIVVKNGTTIEKLAKAQSIALDKTGTITKGNLAVKKITSLSKNLSADDLLQIAASSEAASNHILARSLVSAAKAHQLAFLPVADLAEVTGEGIFATVNKNKVRVGKSQFAGFSADQTTDTAVYIGLNNQAVGIITFADEIRPEAKETIEALRNSGVTTVKMLTGDKKEVAQAIAEKAGITEVHSECLPQDKIAILKTVPKASRPLIMVGDGVNDAPALAIADVGIAMGAHGASAASESADAVILKDDLSKVATAVTISKETMKIARQAVILGIIICIVLMLIASTGVLPALLGAALQEIVDTVAILTALRAKNDR